MPNKPTYEELEQRVRELEASRTLRRKSSLDRVIESIPAGIVVHGADGVVINTNTAAQIMLGLKHEHMLGKELIDPAWTFLREDGSQMPVEEYPVSRVLKTKKPINIVAAITHSEKTELSGLLPICMHCKKVRDDKGYWTQIESYIHEHSEAEFSHGICQECAKKYYPNMDIYDD